MKLVKRTEINKPSTTYNLHVNNNHNYLANGVLVSNCHGAKAEVIKKLINENGKHISLRFGITGTMPKPEVDKYSLKISIGQIVSSVPCSWLIENGYLSKIEIQPIETIDEDNQLPDYGSEKTFLSKNDDRLIALAAQVISAKDDHGNTLVLVNSVAQGKLLSKLIPNSVFLSGESAKNDRKEQYDSYAEKDDLIVIATFGIASTGLSIDRIFCLIMIDAGKSFIRAVQSIGRGLRKKGDKNKVFVLDIYSKLKFSKKHMKDRIKYYKEAEYPTHKSIKYNYL